MLFWISLAGLVKQALIYIISAGCKIFNIKYVLLGKQTGYGDAIYLLLRLWLLT